MEIPVYNNLKEFKQNYLVDYSEINQKIPFLKYLTICFHNYKQKRDDLLLDDSDAKLSTLNNEIFQKMEYSAFVYMEHILEQGIVLNENYDDSNDPKEYLSDLQNFHSIYNYEDKILEYIKLYLSTKDQRRKKWIMQKPFDLILDFISEKIENEKLNLLRLQTTQQPPVIPEPEETPEEKDAKVKFILMKETGLIDSLISQNYKNADIGKILFPIAQIKRSYIENILTADFKIPDVTNSKTAYKRKNILRALDEFDKMGIEFNQLKYFPKLKTDFPELFE